MNKLIVIGGGVAFYFILFLITRIKRNKKNQSVNNAASEQYKENTALNIQNIHTALGGDKYVLDFANEKYNKDNQPSKRGDPLLFESYTPAEPEKEEREKEERKGSFPLDSMFIGDPFMWPLFPSIRRSISINNFYLYQAHNEYKYTSNYGSPGMFGDYSNKY